MKRVMRNYVSVALAAGVCAASFGLTACGGGDKADSAAASKNEVVAQVGATPIIKAAVSHWMATLAGGDYYELSGHHAVPTELVSDPPQYTACVNKLEALAAHSPSTEAKPTGTQLLTKCRQLYEALRQQATEYLVQEQWLINTYAGLGVTVSDQEVQHQLQRWRAENGLADQEKFQEYLLVQRRSLADELVVMMLDVLGQKATRKLSNGGKATLSKLTEAEQSWTSKTTCNAGYVVQHCRQFTSAPPPSASRPPASVLVEQLAALVTGRCINRQACGNGKE